MHISNAHPNVGYRQALHTKVLWQTQTPTQHIADWQNVYIFYSTGSNISAFDLCCISINHWAELSPASEAQKWINAIRANESHIAHLCSAVEWISSGCKHKPWLGQGQTNRPANLSLSQHLSLFLALSYSLSIQHHSTHQSKNGNYKKHAKKVTQCC